MKTIAVLVLCALALSAAYAQDVDEKDVLVLTDDTFDQALKDHPNLLVEFYAPWCGHCKNLTPEYAKAATELADFEPAVKLAKVDATVHNVNAGKHGVRGYPTLKFFVDGEVQDYNGGRKHPEIVNWLKKKVGPPADDLTDSSAVESFVSKASGSDDAVVVVGFFDDAAADAKEAFIKAARSNDEVSFGVTADSAAFDLYSVKSPAVVLFKSFDEKKAVFDGDFTADAIKEFVNAKASPLVQEFTRESSQKIFGGKRGRFPKLFLFHNTGAPEAADLLAKFRESAEKYVDTVVFSNVNAAPGSGNDHILNYFGVTADKLPSLQILDGAGQKKYFTEDGVDGIDKFIADFNAGNAQQAFKSEKAPADNTKPVTVLVADNFKDIAWAQDKDVLVEFYAPWCGHCKKLAPIFDQLGEAFKDIDSVVIAKLDATQNESPEISDQGVRGFPTLKFYPAGHPVGEKGLEFSGGRTLADLAKYIKNNAKSEFTFPEIDMEAAAPPADDQKSEDVPATQDNNVLKVVAKSFKELVLDSEKDVLAEFYAPWCGHCKKLAPVFEELATKFKNVDTVDIVAVDMTANKSPELDALGVRGYPTLKFFPAGKGKAPIDYKSGRSVADFTKFLEENAVHKFTLDEAKEDL